MAVFFAMMVMPFSRSRSIESMTRSFTCSCAPKIPLCQSIASTSVVLPWSTWAMIARLRTSSRFSITDCPRWSGAARAGRREDPRPQGEGENRIPAVEHGSFLHMGEHRRMPAAAGGQRRAPACRRAAGAPRCRGDTNGWGRFWQMKTRRMTGLLAAWLLPAWTALPALMSPADVAAAAGRPAFAAPSPAKGARHAGTVSAGGAGAAGDLPARETLSYGRFGKVALYRQTPHPHHVVLFFSGDGGWNLGVVDMAETLAKMDALVVGVNLPRYLAALAAGKESCSYPAADAELLSKVVQRKLGFPTYTPPVLVGYSSGATLVYALLVEAPPNTFAGAISMGFCPDLPLRKPFCAGHCLTWC